MKERKTREKKTTSQNIEYQYIKIVNYLHFLIDSFELFMHFSLFLCSNS